MREKILVKFSEKEIAVTSEIGKTDFHSGLVSSARNSPSVVFASRVWFTSSATAAVSSIKLEITDLRPRLPTVI